MKVIVVDDEPLARDRMQRLVTELQGYEVVGLAGHGQEAIDLAEQLKPDIILMDIRMPGMDGLKAAAIISDSESAPAIIFCTAYGDYALQAFEVNAVGYLLKPVNQEKLHKALDQAQRLNQVQLAAIADKNETKPRQHLTAKSNRGVELIPLDTIRYCFAEQKYVTVVHLKSDEECHTLIDDPLKVLEQQYPQRFTRVHRNALAAIDFVEGLERVGASYRVVLNGIAEGPQVSRRHVSQIKKLIDEL